MLSLVGEFKSGLKAMTNYHRILKQYGGLPELYNILQVRDISDLFQDKIYNYDYY